MADKPKLATGRYKAVHPVQPLVRGRDKVVRFKPNKIVQLLLDMGRFDMNDLAAMQFSAEDREQFAQLIGYSLAGFGELPYVRDKTYDRASRQTVQGG